MLTAMSELSFAQPERRNFLVPAIVAIAVLAVIAIVVGHFHVSIPPLAADLTVTHVAILPTHTVFKSDSIVVGHQDPFEDDLYVLATVRAVDHLKVPLVLHDITVTLTAPDGTETTVPAAAQKDLPDLYITFPALKPLASAPLLRGSTIQPAGQAEGMVLFSFPIAQDVWNQRKSAFITLDFYNQDPLNVFLPKP